MGFLFSLVADLNTCSSPGGSEKQSPLLGLHELAGLASRLPQQSAWSRLGLHNQHKPEFGQSRESLVPKHSGWQGRAQTSRLTSLAAPQARSVIQWAFQLSSALSGRDQERSKT